jgi:PAS domain-containing protein
VLAFIGLAAVNRPLADAALSRHAESVADRFADDCGLALESAAALHAMDDGRGVAARWSRRLLASHSPFEQRILALLAATAAWRRAFPARAWLTFALASGVGLLCWKMWCGAGGPGPVVRTATGDVLFEGVGDVPGSGKGLDFAAIFASQPTAYLVMSPDLVIVEANRAYLELLGRTREELVGRYVFDAPELDE